MFVPFPGSLAAAEAVNRQARSRSFPAVKKFEDFICRINVFFSPVPISRVVFHSSDLR